MQILVIDFIRRTVIQFLQDTAIRRSNMHKRAERLPTGDKGSFHAKIFSAKEDKNDTLILIPCRHGKHAGIILIQILT